MNYYNIRVQIKAKTGEVLALETHRNFTSSSEAFMYSTGFADGFCMTHSGVLLEKQIEKLNNDRSL